jgi:acyl dehydratase
MPKTEARMPEALLTEELIASMHKRAGTELRIEHSVNNEEATRIAVAKFAAGIGDINPLWTDAAHAENSPYGARVAPPSFVIGCFSGIQFGWPGLGSFHSMSRVTFVKPVYVGDTVHATCTYDGFTGPKQSRFADRMVTDSFTNRYTNQQHELLAEIHWEVVNFERSTAKEKTAAKTSSGSGPSLPYEWTPEELERVEAQVLAESPRGAEPRYIEDLAVGDHVDTLTKGPIGLTDEVAFVVGGGTPIPRLSAHAVALHSYAKHPAWSFRDPETGAQEPIYSVHYNKHAARAMGVGYPYDVGFQRQAWQIHHLTHWCGDSGWVKQCESQYRRFVFLSDVVELSGTVTGIGVDEDGEHVAQIETRAINQRGENVMPGTAVVALPSRQSGPPAPPAPTPAARRARATR